MERQRRLFQDLHHISLVVEDLEASVARLTRLGFGPFVPYPPLRDYTRLDLPDAEAFYGLRIVVCSLGAATLQVIEARNNRTIYGSFLEAGGGGVFHLGFAVEDIDAGEREARARGLHVLGSGRRPDGSGFTYLDTRQELGVTLLLRQGPTPGPSIP